MRFVLGIVRAPCILGKLAPCSGVNIFSTFVIIIIFYLMLVFQCRVLYFYKGKRTDLFKNGSWIFLPSLQRDLPHYESVRLFFYGMFIILLFLCIFQSLISCDSISMDGMRNKFNLMLFPTGYRVGPDPYGGISVPYLCMFSTSSIVSGKAFPLVSGSSNTSPPATRPTTAGSQTDANHIKKETKEAL